MPRGVSEVVADALMSGLKVGCGRISRVVICASKTQRVTREVSATATLTLLLLP